MKTQQSAFSPYFIPRVILLCLLARAGFTKSAAASATIAVRVMQIPGRMFDCAQRRAKNIAGLLQELMP